MKNHFVWRPRPLKHDRHSQHNTHTLTIRMLLLQLVVIPVSIVVKLLECEGKYRRCEDLNDDARHIIEVPAHSVDGEGEEGEDKRAGERRLH